MAPFKLVSLCCLLLCTFCARSLSKYFVAEGIVDGIQYFPIDVCIPFTAITKSPTFLKYLLYKCDITNPNNHTVIKYVHTSDYPNCDSTNPQITHYSMTPESDPYTLHSFNCNGHNNYFKIANIILNMISYYYVTDLPVIHYRFDDESMNTFLDASCNYSIATVTYLQYDAPTSFCDMCISGIAEDVWYRLPGINDPIFYLDKCVKDGVELIPNAICCGNCDTDKDTKINIHIPNYHHQIVLNSNYNDDVKIDVNEPAIDTLIQSILWFIFISRLPQENTVKMISELFRVIYNKMITLNFDELSKKCFYYINIIYLTAFSKSSWISIVYKWFTLLKEMLCVITIKSSEVVHININTILLFVTICENVIATANKCISWLIYPSSNKKQRSNTNVDDCVYMCLRGNGKRYIFNDLNEINLSCNDYPQRLLITNSNIVNAYHPIIGLKVNQSLGFSSKCYDLQYIIINKRKRNKRFCYNYIMFDHSLRSCTKCADGNQILIDPRDIHNDSYGFMFLIYQKSVKRCNNWECKKKTENIKKLYKCSKCQHSWYCSKRCQKYDWNLFNHRLICKKSL